MTRKRPAWRASLVYLAYLVFLIFQPIFDNSTTRWTWIATGLMVVVFVPIYFYTFPRLNAEPYLWSRERRRPGAVLGILGMVALGAVSIPINSGATTFLIYAGAASGGLQPRRRAFTVIGLVMAIAVAAMFLSRIPFPYVLAPFAPALLLIPMFGITTVFERERARANARLAMAQDEIERLAAIAERERIARDLHDLLGHTLSTITLKSELAHRLAAADPERAAVEMRDVERISREALQEVRSAVSGFRARGLQGELANAKLALGAGGVAFDYYAEPLELPPERESALALALREAVTNVLRHADASHCRVRVTRLGNFAELTVEDDGVGGATIRGGLAGMKARLQALGGSLQVMDDRGTRLRVALPLAGNQARDSETVGELGSGGLSTP
ncbi:MAG: sensor histidine kinase [Deinococcales bacterium]